MVRLTLALGGLAATNILLAFAYQWYVLTQLGTTREADALFAGMVVPQLVLAAVGGAMTGVLVPLLAGQDEEGFRRDAWTFFLASTIGFGALAALLGLGAGLWVPLTVPGFAPDDARLTVDLVRIQLLGMILLAQTAILRAVHHARSRFVWAELSLVLAAAAGLAFLIWGLPRLGVAAAAWAFVLKAGLHMACLLPGLHPFRAPGWRTATVHEAWRRLKPLLVGTTYFKLDVFADRFLTSMAAAGELSLLHLAQQVYGAGHQIIGKAIGTPMVTTLAGQARRGDWNAFRSLVTSRLRAIIIFTGVVLAALLLLGEPVLGLLFGHGRLGPADVARLRWLMVALAGLWVGFSSTKILQAGYYAIGDTRTPMKVGMLSLTVGVALKALGFYLHGVIGIALATSAFNLLNAALLYRLWGVRVGAARASAELRAGPLVS